MPVALSTDDGGIARSDLTNEYLRAVRSYGLGYADLKMLARNSIAYSFLPGQSLWSTTRPLTNGQGLRRGSDSGGAASADCRPILDGSPRAQQQWRLEREFADFESRYGRDAEQASRGAETNWTPAPLKASR